MLSDDLKQRVVARDTVVRENSPINSEQGCKTQKTGPQPKVIFVSAQSVSELEETKNLLVRVNVPDSELELSFFASSEETKSADLTSKILASIGESLEETTQLTSSRQLPLTS